MECLDANAVQDLMSDALEAGARSRVMGHLDTCGDCRELLGALARDTVRASSGGHAVLPAAAPPTGLEATLAPPARPTPSGLEATLAAGAAAPAGRQPQPAGGITGLEATGVGDLALGETAASLRMPQQAELARGRALGRYTLSDRLGAGAMGVVYRAEDRELGRHVAVKLLHRPDPALTERLVREARSMAQVNHPNVVAVYDVGVADGSTYIAMELVDGTSLRGWQAGARTIPETLVAYVAAGRGLAAAHAAGIVHRDFKPDNVLVGKDGRVRVTDFGLAAARPGDVATPQLGDLELTRSGTIMGTPAYMAPEQFTGGNVDARTDQFNFCVALYEALYKERPFTGKSFDELGEHVCAGRVRPAPAGAQVSNQLRAIVLRGLAVRPGDRYPTMDHLLDQLARDRARPWRRAALVAGTLAIILGFGLAADWAVRDRVATQIRQAFDATAFQTERAMRLVVGQNDAISSQAYLFSVMRDVATHYDQSDFGLGSKEDDDRNLEELHGKLVSADWQFARNIAGKERPSVIAVADYKGRMLYTSAAPDRWLTDLTQLPWIRQTLDAGTGNTMRLVRYDDPQLVATQLAGPGPRSGLAVMFTRTQSLGESAKSQFIQLFDASYLLDHIDLGDDTLLSVVAPDGTAWGEVPPEVVARTPDTGVIHDRTVGRTTYQVQAQAIHGPDGQVVGRVVMARPLGGVLTLFPYARTVFAAAMLLALALALATLLQARRLAGARV